MKGSLRTGITFGLTSAVITTLGLMVGLHSGTRSEIAVLGGILTIAVADAFSDALGIHVSQEAGHRHTAEEVWSSTAATLAAKFFCALTFAVPVLLLSLSTAITVNLLWGMSILVVLSYAIAKSRREAPWKTVGEHVLIAVAVIGIAYLLGSWVATLGE